MESQVRLRRVYEDSAPEDGLRVLVDRVWPRGLTKATVHRDEWVKDVAPSTQLRRWYAHKPERFAEFRRRYLLELREPQRAAAIDRLRELAHAGPVTLLTATRDVEHSQATVLSDLLREAPQCTSRHRTPPDPPACDCRRLPRPGRARTVPMSLAVMAALPTTGNVGTPGCPSPTVSASRR